MWKCFITKAEFHLHMWSRLLLSLTSKLSPRHNIFIFIPSPSLLYPPLLRGLSMGWPLLGYITPYLCSAGQHYVTAAFMTVFIRLIINCAEDEQSPPPPDAEGEAQCLVPPLTALENYGPEWRKQPGRITGLSHQWCVWFWYFRGPVTPPPPPLLASILTYLCSLEEGSEVWSNWGRVLLPPHSSQSQTQKWTMDPEGLTNLSTSNHEFAFLWNKPWGAGTFPGGFWWPMETPGEQGLRTCWSSRS